MREERYRKRERWGGINKGENERDREIEGKREGEIKR